MPGEALLVDVHHAKKPASERRTPIQAKERPVKHAGSRQRCIQANLKPAEAAKARELAVRNNSSERAGQHDPASRTDGGQPVRTGGVRKKKRSNDSQYMLDMTRWLSPARSACNSPGQVPLSCILRHLDCECAGVMLCSRVLCCLSVYYAARSLLLPFLQDMQICPLLLQYAVRRQTGSWPPRQL